MIRHTQSIAGSVLVGLMLAALAQGQVRDGRSEARGVLKSVDASAGTITVTTGGVRETAAESTYPLAKNVEVATSSAPGRFGVYKEAKLAELSAGASVSLALAPDGKTVESIVAEGPTVRGQLTKVDPTSKTISLTPQAFRDAAAESKTYTLASDAEVAVDDGRGRRWSVKEAKPGDLATGAMVTARLSLDQKQIVNIVAEGPSVFGVIKSLDAAKNTLTLTVGAARGDDAAEEKTVSVAADASVLLDDGRGRRLSVKEGKLSDVLAGSSAVVRLSPDQTTVTVVRAEGPTLTALLKSVDAAKGTIVISILRGRGDAPEEKTLAVSEDARINIDGIDAKLAALKPADNGPVLQIRMSLDQKSVQSIISRQPQGR